MALADRNGDGITDAFLTRFGQDERRQPSHNRIVLSGATHANDRAFDAGYGLAVKLAIEDFDGNLDGFLTHGLDRPNHIWMNRDLDEAGDESGEYRASVISVFYAPTRSGNSFAPTGRSYFHDAAQPLTRRTKRAFAGTFRAASSRLGI